MILILKNEITKEILNNLNKLEDSISNLLNFNIENNVENRIVFKNKCEEENININTNIINITKIISNYRREVIKDTLNLTEDFFNHNKNNKNINEIEIPSLEMKIKEIDDINEIYEEVSINIDLFKQLIDFSIKDKEIYLNKINKIEKIRKEIHDVNNKLTLLSIILLIKILNKEIKENEIKKDEVFFKNILNEVLETIVFLKKECFNN